MGIAIEAVSESKSPSLWEGNDMVSLFQDLWNRNALGDGLLNWAWLISLALNFFLALYIFLNWRKNGNREQEDEAA